MKRISYNRSLLGFNRRVLDQGTPQRGRSYTMHELLNLLFFNAVFVSNTDEMFERNQITATLPDYVELHQQFVANINSIMRLSAGIINWNPGNIFEKRILAYESSIDYSITWFTSIDNVRIDFDDAVYMIFRTKDNSIGVCKLNDTERALYKSGNKFWKTEQMWMDVVKLQYPDIKRQAVFKVTKDRSQIIRKVEYWGDDNLMRELIPVLGHQCLIIRNPYITTTDVKLMMETYDQTNETEVQLFTHVDPLAILKGGDQLIEYPTDSFQDYLEFLRSVVNSDQTKSIFLTLYRIGSDPALYNILKNAIQKNISVHVNIELRASGESINQFWMNELVALGAVVTNYADNVWKVHTKLTLVKFKNGKSICQIGTGNFHTQTTHQYTDLCMMTSDEFTCRQVCRLFEMFKTDWKDADPNDFDDDDFLVTRYNARSGLVKLIRREADKGDDGYIAIKCNALDDDEIINALDYADKRQVRMDLIIRGACTWIPDGLNKNVHIRSIIWEKLEHSRIYVFGAKDPKIYIGSLDLITNKLDRRIETMTRVRDPDTCMKIASYMNRYLTSTTGSWCMTSNGEYRKQG